jgi:tetratricopeptide (TPR) repeat protein
MGMGLECWFDRALAFRPDDPTVRILYADELLRQGKRGEAIQHLKVAEQNANQSATVHYNLGLLYLDLKDYDTSVEHARKAYELGAPLPGLKNLLAQAGKWRE